MIKINLETMDRDKITISAIAAFLDGEDSRKYLAHDQSCKMILDTMLEVPAEFRLNLISDLLRFSINE